MCRFIIFFCCSALSDSNQRLSYDFSNRLVYNEGTDEWGNVSAFGIDYHNVVNDEVKDIGTLTMQSYLTRIDNLNPHPVFDDDDDWKLVTRIFNFNYTGLGKNLPNIKLGHLELPYGIEYRINTNGTLQQYSHGMSLGPKADWGVSINKQTAVVDYEFSLTTGGGQSLTADHNSFVFTGYLGTPSHHNIHYGISVNRSRINLIERENIAMDIAYYTGVVGILAEYELGKFQNQSHKQWFVEMNSISNDEQWLAYVQLRYKTSQGNTLRRDVILGSRYQFSRRLAMSAQLTHLFEQDNQQLSGQLRWRF